jgi:hypothetical protein
LSLICIFECKHSNSETFVACMVDICPRPAVYPSFLFDESFLLWWNTANTQYIVLVVLQCTCTVTALAQASQSTPKRLHYPKERLWIH